MEEIIRIAAQTLNSTETTLYNNVDGAIVKTILLHNTNSIESEITLKFDSVIFLFTLAASETKMLDYIIKTNNIKATGDGVNIHISGLQLGGV